MIRRRGARGEERESQCPRARRGAPTRRTHAMFHLNRARRMQLCPLIPIPCRARPADQTGHGLSRERRSVACGFMQGSADAGSHPMCQAGAWPPGRGRSPLQRQLPSRPSVSVQVARPCCTPRRPATASLVVTVRARLTWRGGGTRRPPQCKSAAAPGPVTHAARAFHSVHAHTPRL